jgi:hypothetical protein
MARIMPKTAAPTAPQKAAPAKPARPVNKKTEAKIQLLVDAYKKAEERQALEGKQPNKPKPGMGDHAFWSNPASYHRMADRDFWANPNSYR